MKKNSYSLKNCLIKEVIEGMSIMVGISLVTGTEVSQTHTFIV